MEYIKLGNSDLNVSRICLGTMGFGEAGTGQHTWTINEAETRTIIKRALELGVNFIDTAILYSGGTCEQYIGRAVRDFARREDVVIATKFYPMTPEELNQKVSVREHVNGLLNQSLMNLGMEYVDLYILHAWDYHAPIEEVMEVLNEAVQSGKVRHIGISNCYAWQIAKANYIARSHGWAQFVSGHYNLLFREEEREMVPFCQEENIALTPYSALAAGRLAKHPGETSKRMQEDSYAKGKYDMTAEQDGIIIDRVVALSEKYHVTMTQISLAWLLTKVTSPVVGATKLLHIEGAAAAVDVKLSKEDIAYLEEAYVPHRLVGLMANANQLNQNAKR